MTTSTVVTTVKILTKGDYPFSIKANDGTNDSATKSLKLTVTDGTVPTINSGDVQNKTDADLASTGVTVYTATADETVTWQLVTGTDNFAIDANSGVVTTVKVLTAGDYSFSIKANDGTNDSATKSLKLTVTSSGPAFSVLDFDHTGGLVPITLQPRLSSN